MTVCQYDQIAYEVKEKIKDANLYYDPKYCHYESAKNGSVWYLHNESFVQVVSIHSIKKFFRVARLLSEPVSLSSEVYSEKDLQLFLDEVLVALKKHLKVDWLESTLAGSSFKAYPEKSKRIRWGNYITDLSDKNADELLACFDSKHRNMVRRGERSGITIKFGGLELLDDYVALDEQTWLRSNAKADNASCYRNVIECFGENSVLGIAYNADGIPQCGLLGFYNSAMFYYMYGASADRPEPGSTHYLQYETMKLMIERGVKAYNFVGCRIDVDKDSKYDRIQHFKKGFGGELVESYMFKAVLNNAKYKAFKALCALKGRKIPTDAIDEELHKWTDIN